jgi:hypothetical protein
VGGGWKIKILEKFSINSVFFPECLWFLFDCAERVTVVLIIINELDLYSKDDKCLLGRCDQAFYVS